ncbi:MAG: HDOD domain-containing protein [Planctomycetota bacterium]
MSNTTPPTERPPVGSLICAALNEYVENESIDLPVLPEVASQVITASMDAECDLRRLTAVIERDPSMTGHLLRLANSALYSSTMEITSLQQALNRLGLKKIRELALIISCESRVFHVDGYDLAVRALFRHSLVTAAFNQELAKRHGMNAEEAFLCGLLHDVGRPVLIQAIADLREKLEIEVGRAAVEDLCAEHHCRVGARLVESWRLPSRIGEAILHHHEPAQAYDCWREAMMIRLAADLSHLTLGKPGTDEEQIRSHPAVGALGIAEDEVERLLTHRDAVRAAVDSVA